MKGFKQCAKGHFYKDAMDECPYCPQGGASSKSEAPTEVIGGGDTQKTIRSIDSEKTQIFGGGTSPDSSFRSTGTAISSDQSFDPTKTIIANKPIGDTSSGNAKDQKALSRRNLRGGLVSFDIEEFGMDYRVIEGRNTIGSNSSNDITVKDGEVSGMHALILCKKDKFIITDELSSNGTFLNGAELTPREPNGLNDGDEIRVGTTNFLFKTAFKN
jgi:pSer/pThr/pTyr-binding forkhead associated (FHA) protein